jgi:hypothetical protein
MFQSRVWVFMMSWVLALPLASMKRLQGAEDRWIEIVERYQLPADPMWSPCIESEIWGWSESDVARRFQDRFAKAKSPASRRAVQKALDAEKRKLSAAKDQAPQLTVLRVWDGIRREELSVILGPGQAKLDKACAVGAVFRARLGSSNAPDHRQSARRLTILEAELLRDVPSEFLYARIGAASQFARIFGEIDLSSTDTWTGTAVKSSVVGDGTHRVSIPLPEGSVISPVHAWYCEFKLMALDSDGRPIQEVPFTGTTFAVCANPGGRGWVRPKYYDDLRPLDASGAFAVINVENPGPFGYVPVVTRAFGVRAVPANGSPATQPGSPAGRELDVAPTLAEPREPATDSLPQVPETPEVPPLSI